ncbi:MAG: hypothetical protein J4F32_04160 [Dehalococcoidia bacterium]|nr:hypothetical protein [Dehalococcoidia bacterium]
MAQPNAGVLTDDQVPGAILDIIRSAEKYVVLVSPYIDLWVHLKTAIEEARQRDVRVTLICRPIDKNALDPQRTRNDLAWLRAKETTVHVVPSLHAKFYLNESSALLTSMNLSGHSSRNSLEVGVCLEAKEQVRDLQEYAKRLTQRGIMGDDAPQATVNGRQERRERLEEKRAPYVIDKDTPKRVLGKVLGRIQGTHCIRCSALIPHNLDKPLCDKCFAIWDEYKNREYTERYCHACGKEAPTTYAKPRCASCYAAA